MMMLSRTVGVRIGFLHSGFAVCISLLHHLLPDFAVASKKGLEHSAQREGQQYKQARGCLIQVDLIMLVS